MKRAQSMAQAAWTTRPSLQLSSWSCIGPRHRATAASSNSGEGGSPGSGLKAETSEPLLTSPDSNTTTASTGTIEHPASSGGAEWTSEIEYSCTDEMASHAHMGADLDRGEDLMSDSHEDRMNEVELWQQLEHELYDRSDSEDADVAKEIREEEAAAIAEVGEDQPGSTAPGMKEVRRFFPPGKIMHIVTLHLDSAESEGDTSTSSGSDNNQPPVETKVGIFRTPRTLYGKLRLSQTMVSDHFMPVYRRQIEKLIKELEEEEAAGNHKDNAEVVL